MKFQVLCIFFGFTFSSGLKAQDVGPIDKIGSLTVEVPDLKKFSPSVRAGFDIRKLQVLFSVEPNRTVQKIVFGQTYRLAAGKGCLRINYRGNRPYERHQCGIEIKNKQETVVSLAALHLSWLQEPFRVDFGAKPTVYISSREEVFPFVGISPYHDHNNLLILVAGQYKIITSNHDIAFYHELNINLKSNDQKTVDITPPDERAEVVVKFDNWPAKFPQTQSNYVVINYRSKPFLADPSRFSRAPIDWRPSVFGSSNMPERLLVRNFYSIDPDQETHKLFAFPLKSLGGGPHYEIVANETFRRINIRAEDSIEISVATVNVNNFDTGHQGTFKIFRLDRDNDGERFQFPLNNLIFANGHPYLVPKERATSRTINLIGGDQFLFELYAFDDFGRKELQDSVTLSIP